jgi:fucose 4-O-acetylase-like acetyltransferase
MIILVLSMHSVDTYSPFGNWYYTDRPPRIDLATALAFGSYQSFLQAFFMALLFFIAGFFAAPSYDRKGFARFARDRWLRLGVPTLLFMVIVGPLTQYFLSRTWGTGGFLHQWLVHLCDAELLSETGPMWFAAVLLVFSLLYGCTRAVARTAHYEGTPPSGRSVVGFILLMACATFAVRIFVPQNVAVLNVHPGDFPQYILMFCAGILAYRRGWLENVPTRWGLPWATGLLVASAALFAALMIYGGAVHGDTSRYAGGYNIVSFGKSVWESAVCVGASLAIVVGYREFFNAQGGFAKLLSDNAFAVYLFHPPVIIVLAILLHSVAAPAPLKAALLTLSAAVVTFSLAALVVRRIPPLRRIL